MIGIANAYPLLEIISTTCMQIQYWLVTQKWVNVKDIHTLWSHPQALYQTRDSQKKIFWGKPLKHIDTMSTSWWIEYIHKNFWNAITPHYGGVIAPFQYIEMVDKDIVTVHSTEFWPKDNFTHFALMQCKGQDFQHQLTLPRMSTAMKFKKVTLNDIPGSLLEELQQFYEKWQSVYGITSISNVDDTTDFMVIYTDGQVDTLTDYWVWKKPEWRVTNIQVSDTKKHDYLATLSITPEHWSLWNAIWHFSRNNFDIREITSIPTGYGRIDFNLRFRALVHSNMSNLERAFDCSYMIK